jgi:hypothetical protein
VDEVNKNVRDFVVALCNFQQPEEADIGPEQIQVEMNCGTERKRIGEISLGDMSTRSIITESYLHSLDSTGISQSLKRVSSDNSI